MRSVNADFAENVAGLRVTQAFLREERNMERFTGRSFGYRVSRVRAQRYIAIFFPFIQALSTVASTLVLVLAVGQVLDIDIREMNAGYRPVRYRDDQFADIFLYDTLSGGAGYATQAGKVFREVFAEAELLLGQCDCQSSCDKCLRHYGNRFHHDSLDRFLALDLVRFIKVGCSPEPFDWSRQQEELKPLAIMLKLAGWQISDGGEAPVTATRFGRSVALWSYPSLVDPKALGFVESAAAFAFSPYELSRDLPGAFAEIT